MQQYRVTNPGTGYWQSEMSGRLKHIGCLAIFVGLLSFAGGRQAAAWSLFKDSICTLFPIAKIVREIDAGNGYKHDKKQVYDAYYKIATSIIRIYKSELNRLHENHFDIGDAYDINPLCIYNKKIEYDAKKFGIKITNQWTRSLNFSFYTRNNEYIHGNEYINGNLAFTIYEVQLRFSKDGGDLLEIHVQKHNINFDRFPFYALWYENDPIPLSQREQGLTLKKTEFPHG